MDSLKSAGGHWSTGVAVLVLGIGAFIIGVLAHGDGGSDLRSTGLLVTGIAMGEIRHARTLRYLSDAYRSGRTDKRRVGPVLVSLPRCEEPGQ